MGNYYFYLFFLQGVQCVEDVKELIMDQCEKNTPHSVTEQLEKIFSDISKPVGLLLSERFINVPPQIALPLHKQLQWVLSFTSHHFLAQIFYIG